MVAVPVRFRVGAGSSSGPGVRSSAKAHPGSVGVRCINLEQFRHVQAATSDEPTSEVRKLWHYASSGSPIAPVY